MTEAEYWRVFLHKRLGAEPPHKDVWSVTFLNQVTTTAPDQAGYDGYLWKFRDGSSLYSNSEGMRAINPGVKADGNR